MPSLGKDVIWRRVGDGNNMSENIFATLKHFSVSHGISAQIHAALLSGRLKPGQQITELDICKAAGVSRASVREALQQLRASGMVTTVRRRTYISGEPDAQEIREVYMSRGVCEALAAEDTRNNLLPSDLERLELYLRRMEEASCNKDLESFWNADLAFHDLLWKSNGKAHLQRVLQSITSPLHAFLLALLRRSTVKELRQISKSHREYLNDLRRLRGNALRERIERHYQALGQTFIAIAQRQRWKRFTKNRGPRLQSSKM
jgi:DNA-binding GntR family transcriptional regulator